MVCIAVGTYTPIEQRTRTRINEPCINFACVMRKQPQHAEIRAWGRPERLDRYPLLIRLSTLKLKYFETLLPKLELPPVSASNGAA